MERVEEPKCAATELTKTGDWAVMNPASVRARALELIARSGMKHPPFKVETLAALQGVKRIVRADLGTLDALLVRTEDGFVIKVNSCRPPTRQNFSCAHEIVHTFFEQAGTCFRRPGSAYPAVNPVERAREERLCNLGAAELLMPGPVFSDCVRGYGRGVSALRPLATLFEVSVPAVSIRLAQSHDTPTLAICSRYRTKRGSLESKLRVEWAAQAESKAGRRDCYVPRDASIDPTSSIFDAYAGDKPTCGLESLRLGRLKGRFFVESKGFGFGSTRYVITFVHLQ